MKRLPSLIGITLLSIFLLAWCTNKNSVRAWDTISLVYTATFQDGTLFDHATDQAPLTFTVWSGQVISWLDQGVVGMKIGKTKTISIVPDQWYGKLYDVNNIQKISKLIFDKLSIKTEKWSMQKLGNFEGVVKGTETDWSWSTLVLFDINPRQTRDTLQYTITVLSKQ